MSLEDRGPWGPWGANVGHTLHSADLLVLSAKPKALSGLQPHSAKSLKSGRLMQQVTSNRL